MPGQRRQTIGSLDVAGYARVAELLREGGLVCMPTDTVYGLAVDAMNPNAVSRLFEVKGRAPDRPVILLVDSVAMARRLTWPGADFDGLTGRFWPGPLSVVLPARDEVLGDLTAGTGTIALRWPRFEPAVRIIHALGGPITSTSANRSGEPVVRSADEAASVLPDIDLVLDGGPIAPTEPSTLVDLTRDPPALLRPGAVPFGEVTAFLASRGAGRPA